MPTYVFVCFFFSFVFFSVFFFLPPFWFPDDNSWTPWPIALKFSGNIASTSPLCAIVFQHFPKSKMAARCHLLGKLAFCYSVLEQFCRFRTITLERLDRLPWNFQEILHVLYTIVRYCFSTFSEIQHGRRRRFWKKNCGHYFSMPLFVSGNFKLKKKKKFCLWKTFFFFWT